MSGIVEKLLKFQYLNSEQPGSFDKRDERLLKTPSYAARLAKIFSKTPFGFEVFAVNTEISSRDFTFAKDWTGEWTEARVQEQFDPSFKQNPSAITLIMTNNYADSGHPLSPWIVAHRFSHAVEAVKDLSVTRFYRVLKAFRNSAYKAYVSAGNRMHHPDDAWIEIVAMMTTRSARDARSDPFSRMHDGEAEIELLTQFVATGMIRFDYSHFDDPKLDYPQALRQNLQQSGEKYQRILNKEAANTLQRCVGRIFVI